MPLTRSQTIKSVSSSRRDDAPDLFEPTTHRGSSSRPTNNATNHRRNKRPALTSTTTTHLQPDIANKNKKQRRVVARRELTIPAAAPSRPNEEDENSTTANSSASTVVVATVTPASSRVRSGHPLSAAQPPRLPDGVVNIFDTTTDIGNADALGTSPTSQASTSSSSSLWKTAEEAMRSYVTSFMHTYGPEYYHQIYIQEEQEFHENMSALSIVSADDDPSPHQFQMTEPPLKFDTVLPFQPLLTVRMRHVLVSWLAEVTAEFKLSQCAYHLAASMLDELLLMGPTMQEYKEEQELESRTTGGIISDDDDDNDDDHFLIKPRTFQAVGCACIWIASKIEDRTPPTSEQLTFISDNACSAESLLQLEARIMELFKFRPLRITPVHFLDIHERASQASTAFVPRRDIHQHNPQFHHMILYILQLGRSNFQLSREKPSLVAAAACFLTRATLGLRSAGGLIWTPTLEFYTGYPLLVLNRVVVLLLISYMEAEKLNSALFTIYRQQERYRVSLKTAPRIADLGLLGVPEPFGLYESLVEMMEERKTTFVDEA